MQKIPMRGVNFRNLKSGLQCAPCRRGKIGDDLIDLCGREFLRHRIASVERQLRLVPTGRPATVALWQWAPHQTRAPRCSLCARRGPTECQIPRLARE